VKQVSLDNVAIVLHLSISARAAPPALPPRNLLSLHQRQPNDWSSYFLAITVSRAARFVMKADRFAERLA
jgi:hypothetical protein